MQNRRVYKIGALIRTYRPSKDEHELPVKPYNQVSQIGLDIVRGQCLLYLYVSCTYWVGIFHIRKKDFIVKADTL